MDVIGAAETGSGKTLAFGIPIIHGILHDKQYEAECLLEDVQDSGVENSDHDEKEVVHSDEENSLGEQSKNSEENDDEENDEAFACQEEVKVDESFEDVFNSEVSEDEKNSDQDNEQSLGCVKVMNNIDFDFLEEAKDNKKNERCQKKLRALIITPTRELAIQVIDFRYLFFNYLGVVTLYH